MRRRIRSSRETETTRELAQYNKIKGREQEAKNPNYHILLNIRPLKQAPQNKRPLALIENAQQSPFCLTTENEVGVRLCGQSCLCVYVCMYIRPKISALSRGKEL